MAGAVSRIRGGIRRSQAERVGPFDAVTLQNLIYYYRTLLSAVSADVNGLPGKGESNDSENQSHRRMDWARQA